MITGMTIGAGVLGIPYVIARVGLLIGISYIIVIGMVMLGLNLMIGEVAVKTSEQLQLPGLSGRYLGNWAKYLSSFLFVGGAYGSLLVFIVGEGESLSALFGGNPIWWGVIYVMAGEQSTITPPFGLSLFVLRSVVPKNSTRKSNYIISVIK